MRCLYCDKLIDKYTLRSLFIMEDKLCVDCRDKLKIRKEYIKLNDLKIETFYEYDSLFKTLLLQYKECYDEPLKDVFLYGLETYLYFKYHNYEIVLIPSSKKKLEERGFNHLELIFENVGLKINYGLQMKEELIQEGKSINQRQEMINNYIYTGDFIDKALVVDDVITTGSSILGAKKCLTRHTNIVKYLVLAK